MIKLYGVPSCKKIRDTKTLFEKNAVKFESVNVKKAPISESQLRGIVDQLGLATVLNSKGPTFRKLGLKEKNLKDNDLFQWLLKEQGMISRPLIERNGKYCVGFDEQNILKFVK